MNKLLRCIKETKLFTVSTNIAENIFFQSERVRHYGNNILKKYICLTK